MFTALASLMVTSLVLSSIVYACQAGTDTGSQGNQQFTQGGTQTQGENSQNEENQSQNKVLGSQNSENSQGSNANVPGPDFINICHQTNSENNPWQAIRIDTSAWPQHEEHGDYRPYEGPMKDNGHPDNFNNWADDWCADNSGDPEPTPTPEQNAEPTPTPTPETNNSSEENDDSDENSECSAQAPTSAPELTIEEIRTNSVVLKWTAVEPVTNYTIRYGHESGNYIFGVSDTGNVTTYEVNLLNEEQTYYFQVAGVNHCAQGPWSNEVSKRSRLVLGASTSTSGYVLGAIHLPVAAGFAGMDLIDFASKVGVLGFVFFGLSKLTKRFYLFGR